MIKVPVLLIVFNRPDTTLKVFEQIKNAEPKKLYISCDAPRTGNTQDKQKIDQVLRIVSEVTWESEVHFNLRKENLGINDSMISALNWFFSQESMGIILEDDCLPSLDFFKFCEELLQKYEFDERVWTITGNNFQNGKKVGNASYYFSKYNHVWGWATWDRAWKNFDENITFWPNLKNSPHWKSLFLDRTERDSWEAIFDDVHSKNFNSWDYSWTASVWYQRGLTATPNVNLVSNIGFGPSATNTRSKKSKNSNIPTVRIVNLIHPSDVLPNLQADVYVFNKHFGGTLKRFPLNVIYGSSQYLKKFHKKFFLSFLKFLRK